MRIGAIRGDGPIGSKLVTKLGAFGYEAVEASPNSEVNIVTAEGLADAREGASVVVDVSNSPSSDGAAVLEFFETSVAYFGDVEHSFRLVPNARSG
jgi:hypothetical protein